MRSKEEKLRQILDEFGKALVEAAGDSSAMNATIQRIRQEGYSLHLVLGSLQKSAGSSRGDVRRASSEPPARAPTFRLSSDDVGFLKSIGIDPTRSVRRRRKPRSMA